MADPIFTDYRRDLMAKTAADFLKILFAAAVASRFFMEFPPKLKAGLLALGLVLSALALLACPIRKPDGG